MNADSISAPERATTLTTKETWNAAFAAWETAVIKFEFAEAAFTAAHDEAGGDEHASEVPAVAKLAAIVDDLAGVENETRFALLLTPAPDFAAATWKMTKLYSEGDFEGDEHSSAWHRRYPEAVIADMQRLQTEFAEAWLTAWTQDGGAVMICPDGELQYSFPTYDRSPRYIAPAEHMDEQFAAHFLQTNDQHYHSTMNARVETLRMIPGGRGMIKSYMQAKGLCVAMTEREQRA